MEKILNNVTSELNETKDLVTALKIENEETKVILFKKYLIPNILLIFMLQYLLIFCEDIILISQIRLDKKR